MSKRDTRPKVRPVSVTLAYVHDAEVAHSWHRSVTELLLTDLSTSGRIMRGGFVAIRYSTGGIVKARNQAAAAFLADPSNEWLFWVDTDMGFAPDTLDKLLAAADPVARPIVGALCFSSKEMRPDGLHGYWTAPLPTILDWVTLPSGESGFQARFDYEKDAVVRCSGTGSACILIHRSVFEKVGPDPYEPLRNPTTGEIIGEDLAFCARAAEHDIPVHVHTGVPTSHLKPIWMGETQYAMWPQT